MLSMKFYFDKRVLLGFFVALTIIIWLGVNSFLNSKKFAETSKLVVHTNEVLFHTEQLLSQVIQMETNQRGYVLTFNDAFLPTIEIVSDSITHHFNDLLRLTSDNVSQQKRLGRLDKLIEAKIVYTQNVIVARRVSFESASDTIQTMRGKILMEEIGTLISEMQNEERVLLQQRVAVAEINFERFNNTLASLLATTAIILILVFIGIHYSLKIRARSQMSLKRALMEIEDLYENAPCGYYSLNKDGLFVNINRTLLSWLGHEKNEIIDKLRFTDIITPNGLEIFEKNFPVFKKQGFIHNLQFDFVRKDGATFPVILNSTAIFDSQNQFVKSRSIVIDITESKKAEIKIKQLNHELEAFTYSVSHDLRSPLRSIDGYTKILEEEYASKLDQEGVKIMQTIIRNTKRMSQLIDDLLNFSRIGRKDLVKTDFDTENLVRQIIDEQMEQVTNRKINIDVKKLNGTYADNILMRQVWENLISNALKYTRKAESANIEIGSYIDKNEMVFYIKDNGVGFDMAYSHKLFGVFQRLHKAQDFEGTGVGLAIVYRVITRHGGRIWAHSKLNEGTTLTFTLPVLINE